jgi:anti-anti-sigma factor
MIRDSFICIGDHGSVLVACGELDIASTPRLVEATDHAAKSFRDLTVDLSAVTFMDCAALGALLRTRKDLGRRGGVLTLRAPHRSVVRLLRLAGLEHAFPIVVPTAVSH